MLNILIPERVLNHPNVDSYELMAYCYLRALTAVSDFDEYCLSTDSIFFAMYQRQIIGKKTRANILKAINNLIDLGFVDGERYSKTLYFIQRQSLIVDQMNERYTIIHFDDIQRIMASDSPIKPQLVKFYIYLMSKINSKITVYDVSGEEKKNIIGMQPQQYLSHITGMSTHTIMRYNRILEDMEVIYVCRSNDFIVTDSGLKQFANVYGRYADKEYLIKYGNSLKEQYGSYNHTYKKKTETNTKRRLAQMYLQLCKGKMYSEEEIKEIYDYITAQNQKYRNLAQSEQNNHYLENIKDETVFRQFEFLDF